MNIFQKIYRYNCRPEHSGTARFFSSLIAGASYFFVLGLWACAIMPYVDPRIFKVSAVVALMFPVFLFGTLFQLLLSALFAPRRCWIPLLGLLICIGPIHTYAPLHFFSKQPTGNADTELCVMSYNTRMFGGTNAGQDSLAHYITSAGVQIACIQEGVGTREAHDRIRRNIAGTATPYYTYNSDTGETLALISAYPIIRTQLVTRSVRNAVVAFWVELSKRKQLLVINCHLNSNQLSLDERNKYSTLMHHRGEVPQQTMAGLSRRMAAKIAKAAQVRANMVDTLSNFLSQHKDEDILVCGDFNDTPVSYCRRRIAACDLQDAYRLGGTGIGRSFNQDAIWVRIDHIFVSRRWQVLEAHIDNKVYLSDHFPIIATFRYPYK